MHLTSSLHLTHPQGAARYRLWVPSDEQRDSAEWLEEYASALTSMVPVVGPLASPLVKRLARASVEEQRRNRSRALAAAERVSGLSREDLGEHIADHPELIPLLARVLHAAAMTGQEDILAGLGAVLGKAVGDDPERLDEAEFILGIMADLRRQHIHVLRCLSQIPTSMRGMPRYPPLTPGPSRWSQEELLYRTAMREDLTLAALTALVNYGLIKRIDYADADSAWELTNLGKDMVELFEAFRG